MGKNITIHPELINDACKKAAKQAFDLGETDDEDNYKETMEEIITDVLRQKQKKKRPNN